MRRYINDFLVPELKIDKKINGSNSRLGQNQTPQTQTGRRKLSAPAPTPTPTPTPYVPTMRRGAGVKAAAQAQAHVQERLLKLLPPGHSAFKRFAAAQRISMFVYDRHDILL
ncbi:hypothetical protein B0H14DRAFT_3431236 [Mycena olivaceomarginata]|nr:hypothetical protein B0H14DRAFT_3431236 [Mycena olivaceomarginata]